MFLFWVGNLTFSESLVVPLSHHTPFCYLPYEKNLLMSLMLMFTCLHGALAQTRVISGRVTD